jgi:DNA-directed RNA polymerase specialized sigma24 family protein
MQYPELLWFDREFDSFGKPIRADVREAAKAKWPQLSAFARRRLGDRELEIQELFEKSVEKVSRHLDRKNAPSQDPSALLVIKFRQELHTLWRRLDRVAAKGNSTDLEPMLATSEWGEEANRHIFLEELVRYLSKQNRTVLRLRGAGYEWSEIAKMVHSNASTVRNNFWREVRRVFSELNEILEDRTD